jgi:hypothetical protein
LDTDLMGVKKKGIKKIDPGKQAVTGEYSL